GQVIVDEWWVVSRRALAFRYEGNDERFFDMDFVAEQRDPIGEVKRLYAWLGGPVSAEFEAGMHGWWRAAAASRAANTHPDAATFGLTMETVRPLFADYIQHIAAWTAATAGEVARP